MTTPASLLHPDAFLSPLAIDEAVQRAIFAESLHEATSGRSTAELNRQSAEILKFIAESL